MFKKTLLAALAVVAALCISIPAAAQTFTASNGVLSIELPDEGWREISDPAKWIVLSDGANMISVEHYSNGETLPSMSVADNHYVNVYQAVFSTQNEVFIITGSVVDSAKIPQICEAIMSAKVLQYNTKMAVKKQDAVSSGEFTVVPMSATMYTTDGINVRLGCSTTSEIIGALAKGEAVQVTGKVQRNGQDYGWYQIAYDNGNGYVSASFLTESADKAASDQKTTEDDSKKDTEGGFKFTGNAITIYYADGTPLTVYEANDGNWYASDGTMFYQTSSYEFSSADGTLLLTANRPVDNIEATGESFTAYWLNGNGETLTPFSDGYYYSSDWIRYYYQDGVYIGTDGSVLYTTPVAMTNGSGSAPEYDGDWFTVYWLNGNADSLIHATDGYYYNSDGVRYEISGSETFEGSDGTVLYMEIPDPEAVADEENAASSGETHKLLSQETGRGVIVTAGGGAFFDSYGNEYYFNDSTAVDDNGEVYDILW